MKSVLDEIVATEANVSGTTETVQSCQKERAGVQQTHKQAVRGAPLDLADLYGSDDLSASGRALRLLMQTSRKWTRADFDL